MKYKVYIPHTNNIKVTKLCLDNLTNNTKDIIVIDNSIEKDCQVFRDNFEVIETPVQLHTAQTYNYIKNLSNQSKLDCFFFMHSDCIVENKETLNQFVQQALALLEKDSRTGWVHADNKKDIPKDLLCCYRCGMLDEVEGWNALKFPFYFLDLDLYNKVVKNKWSVLSVEANVEHLHKGSVTVKSDMERSIINAYYYAVSKTIFDIDWR